MHYVHLHAHAHPQAARPDRRPMHVYVHEDVRNACGLAKGMGMGMDMHVM
jgi:hypothetical protein